MLGMCGRYSTHGRGRGFALVLACCLGDFEFSRVVSGVDFGRGLGESEFLLK